MGGVASGRLACPVRARSCEQWPRRIPGVGGSVEVGAGRGRHDRPVDQDQQLACEHLGGRCSRCHGESGEITPQSCLVVAGKAAHSPGSGAQLAERVDECAAAEARLGEPLGEEAENGKDALAGVCMAVHIAFERGLPDPVSLLQVGLDQVLLGWIALIEAPEGGPGRGADLVDADRLYPPLVEEPCGRGKKVVAGL